MKKTISFIAGLLLALTGMAQENKGGISGFMKEELEDFDKFMDDANKDFINFMREPWKEFEAEKPVLKRVKPEPVKPVIYDEKTAPKSEKPICLTIEEILDMTTSEGKQKPVVQLNEVDRIVFDKPEVIVRKNAGSCEDVFKYLALKVQQAEDAKTMTTEQINRYLQDVIDVVVHIHNDKKGIGRHITDIWFKPARLKS